MEPDQQDMREKRIQAVMKLKRAASLPRMADGRRPPMHPEGVSDGERMQAQESQMPGEGEVVPELPTEEQREPVAEPERQQEDEVEEEEERPEPDPEPTPDVDAELETPEPEPDSVAQEERPATRPAKRRSRSRSRSRGSKDFKGKARAALSPTPTLQLNGGDSSLDEALPFDVPSPMPSPMPAQLFELQRLRMLRSPTPMSTDPPQSPFNANMFLRNPTLPTLEALQKGLIRSNSTNSRAEALRKLTGGTDTYDPTPMAGLSRNNTVTGGERLAARNALFNLIGGRITKETDSEQFSGSDERPTPEPTPKRRRRRSRRGSLAQANAGASEGDIDSSSPPPPPSIPPTPTPPVIPTVPPIRSLSRPTTPHLGEVRSWEQHPNRDNMPSPPDPRPSETTQSYEPAGNGLRRRSVVVEEDDDDNVPTSPPIQYDTAALAYQVQMRNSPQLPWNRASPFPQHQQQQRPYVQEVPTTDDDEEEQVLFGAETHRARTPFMDNFDREISWIADPVPELGIRIVDDKDTDEEEPVHEELGTNSPPLSPASFSAPEGENPTFGSPSQASLGSKSLLVESETSPPSPSSNLPQSSSGTALAHIIAPPIASANSTSSMTQPAVSPSTPFEHADVEERAVTESGSKRNDERSTWEKVKGAFRSGTGRRSRTNSIARRDQRESSVSHESGVSHISTKVERGEMASAPTTPQHQGAPILAQANSTSGSMMSLGPPPSRGGPSPIPPASSADMLKYRDAKLFPFPGIHKLEQEQRDRRKIGPSTSTPDILSFPRGNDEENLPVNAASSPPTPQHAATEIGRERKLSQKNSDSQLAKTSNSFRDHIPFLSRQSSTTQASETGGLPKTLADVRQYMLSRDGSRGRSTSRPGSPGKPHLTLPGQPLELEDWEEVRLTPVSQSGSVDSRQNENKPREAAETESTPKGKKVYKDVNSTTTSPSPPSVPSSRPDPFSSATPDPSSSLSDYPAPSTSESSSTNSSRYSGNRHQGPALLEKLTEDLNHGTLSRLSSSIDEDQKRRLLLSSQVFQVVNANTLKDRFLFLFSDILVIAKPVMSEQDAHDSYRTNPTDKRFVVKSIVQLTQLRWTADRTDAASDPNTYNPLQNPTMKAFITNFSRDPEHAISVLQMKSGVSEDPVAVGQLLFRTPDLDRFRLGEYLVKRSSKGALRAYLDSFEFKGMRIDDALRVFLLSMNVPGGLTSHNSGLQYLLDAYASRWYEANATVVDFDKDCAHLLVRATIQLNELLHGTQSRERVPYSAFAGAFRRYDSRLTVSEKLLEDIYISISNEKLFQACSLTSSTVPIIIKRPVPPRMTWKLQSDPIILRLPHADPDLQIKLDGQELEFDPPILTFTRSPEASFRVKGLQLGPKSIIFRRMGPNADRYTGLPLSSSVVVERAFMRHTFQIAFRNHHGAKRHYMFSVEDSLLRHQWVSYFKQHVDTANNKSPSGANGHNKFKRAIDLISFKALQDTLIASPPRPANVVSKAIQRLNTDGPSQQNGHRNGDFLHSDSPSHHTRSKSRSKFYHQQGVGKHEATFLSGQEGTSDRDESESESRNLGPIWSARDLELHCRHNGSVASVVMNFLEKDKELNNS